MRATRTYALLEVSPEAHAEIKALLLAAGYDHAVNADGEIDMHGIALTTRTRVPIGAAMLSPIGEDERTA